MSSARPIPRARPAGLHSIPSLRRPSSLRSSPAPQIQKSKAPRSCANVDCDKSDIREIDGQLICHNCGAITSDSVIVNDVTFGEAPSGAALVQGTTVHQGQRYAKPSGTSFRRGGRTAEDAHEVNVRTAKDEMTRLANVLKIAKEVDTAMRLYTLGRIHQIHRPMIETVAVCLYIACRMGRDNQILLIDIAEKIQRNVFDMGTVYKSFVRDTNLAENPDFRNIPVIEIEPMIYKFAKQLEFGDADATRQVAADAVLILSRMKRDWMVTGRQPQALCGSALILAARMNNFRRSVREVVYIVKAGDTTITKRLGEFRRTRAGNLTVSQFRQYSHTLKDNIDPPSVYEARERKLMDVDRYLQKHQSEDGSVIVISSDESSSDDDEEEPTATPRIDSEGFAIPSIPSQKRRSSSSATKPSHDLEDVAESSSTNAVQVKIDQNSRESSEGLKSSSGVNKRKRIARNNSNDSPVGRKKNKRARSVGKGSETSGSRASRESSVQPNGRKKPGRPRKQKFTPIAVEIRPEDLIEENALEASINDIVHEAISTNEVFEVTAARAKAVAEVERARERRQHVLGDVIIGEDEFDDDPEVANCLLTAAEIEVKEMIWVTHNHDWLRRQQELILNKQMEEAIGKKKRKVTKRSKNASEYDTPASTPAEATQRLMAKKNGKPAFSRHINYEALQRIYKKPEEQAQEDTSAKEAAEVEEIEELAEEHTQAGADEVMDSKVGADGAVAKDGDEEEEEEAEEDDDDEEEEEEEEDGHTYYDDDEEQPYESDYDNGEALDGIALGGNEYFDD